MKFISQVECFVIHSIGSLGSFRRNRVGKRGEGFKKEVKSVRLSKQHFLKSFHSFIQTHIEAYSSSSLDNCMFISISVLAAAAFAVSSSSHVSRFCTITFT